LERILDVLENRPVISNQLGIGADLDIRSHDVAPDARKEGYPSLG
jgi:hypothetical protein